MSLACTPSTPHAHASAPFQESGRSARSSSYFDFQSTTAVPEDPKQHLALGVWLRWRTMFSSFRHVLEYCPLTLIVPVLVLLGFIISLELSIRAAAASYRSYRVEATSNTVGMFAQDLDSRLQSYMDPIVAAAAAIGQQPHVPSIIASMPQWAASILTDLQTSQGALQMQLLPWNIKAATCPFKPADLQALNQDLNLDPRMLQYMSLVAPQGPHNVLGPLETSLCPLTRGYCVQRFLWLPSRNPNETWGNEETFTAPWALDSSGALLQMGNKTIHPKLRYQDCGSVCRRYDSLLLPDGSWLTYWGIIKQCICRDAIVSQLGALASPGWNGIAYRFMFYKKNDTNFDTPLTLTLNKYTVQASDIVVYASDDRYPHEEGVKKVCTFVGNGTRLTAVWVLCLTPVDGYEAAWYLPLQIVVAFCSLMMAWLVFMLLLSHNKNSILVQAMMPSKAAQCLRLGRTYAESFKCCTILFSEIVNYSDLSAELAPNELVDMLDQLYLGYDDLVDKHELYKIETKGSAFMAVGGAPVACVPCDAARRVGLLALDMIRFAQQSEFKGQRKIQIRVGIFTGQVTAAVMGRKMPHWTVIGDCVNMASRMDSTSLPMQIHIGYSTVQLLRSFPDLFHITARGTIDIKGKGPMKTFWLKPPSGPAICNRLDSLPDPLESVSTIQGLTVHSESTVHPSGYTPSCSQDLPTQASNSALELPSFQPHFRNLH